MLLLPVAQRLHLGAGQHDAGLEGLADLVVEARPAVLRRDLAARRLSLVLAISAFS